MLLCTLLCRREVERRTHPLSKADFVLLEAELESWRQQQTAAIKNAGLVEQEEKVRHTTTMHTGTSMVQQHAVALRWLCCAACLKPALPAFLCASTCLTHGGVTFVSWLLCAGGTAAAAGKGDSAAAHTGQAAGGSAPGAACDRAAEDTGSPCAA